MKQVHFTKYMIDLFFEIRSRQPPQIKSTLKIASSNLYDGLLELHRKTKDQTTKLLISEFIELTNPSLYQRFQESQKKSYDSLVSNLKQSLENKQNNNTQKKQLIYRGLAVE